MTSGEIVNRSTPAELVPLPRTLHSLNTKEAIFGLTELWLQPQNREHLIPDALAQHGGSTIKFRRDVAALSSRRNAIMTAVTLNNFGVYLAGKNWTGGIRDIEQYLLRQDFAVPPGLDLSDKPANQRFWIDGVIGGMSPYATSWGVKPMTMDEDFVRWWNQVSAIDTFRALTAGHESWEQWSEFMIQQGSPIGNGRWVGWSKQAVIPTAKGIKIQLYAQQDLCELLQLGKADKRGRNGYWTLFFETSRIGSRSGNGYARDTGLKVGHIHLAALLEHLRPRPMPLKPWNLMNTHKPTPTAAAQAASASAFAQLTDRLTGAGGPSRTPVLRPGRRLARSSESSLQLPQADSGDIATSCWVLTDAELKFRPVTQPDAESPYWASLSLGSIRIDPTLLNPRDGLAVVHLHTILLHGGKQHTLNLEMVDDETESGRVHLVPTDPLAWPWVRDEGEARRSLEALRRAMTTACWSLTLEADYSRVAHIGLALSVLKV